MLFHTLTFLIFFTITVALLLIARNRHATQKNMLVIASAIFYMWWNPAFILLILFSAGVDYIVAARLDHTEEQRKRRNLLLVSLITNFGLLAFFKYTGFLEQNMLYVFRLFGYKPNSAVIWLAAICFYVQIYCDFSGYSDMAIAIARMLGYELVPNFNRPYFSANPSEFWKRWHISLSTWLRDYLYIPLGGNRDGEWR